MKIDTHWAIVMLVASWKETGTNIITNCFNKVQITKGVQVRDSDSEEPSSPPDLSDVWGTMSANRAVSDNVQLRNLLCVDNCAMSNEEVPDEALVVYLRDHNDNDDESFEANQSELCSPPGKCQTPSMFYAALQDHRMMILR